MEAMSQKEYNTQLLDQMKEIKNDLKQIRDDVHDTKITLSAWEEKFVTKDQVIKVLAWIVCTLIAVSGLYLTFKGLK